MLKLSSPTADRRLALVGCHQSMPTRRTPIDRARRVQITPAMVALWKRGREILATKAEQKWEEEGGRRDDAGPSGCRSRKLNGRLDRFCARICEKHLV